MKYHLEVHGCQMNVADSERVATVCERNGYCLTENWHDADLIIYLSCSIKQKAEDKIIGHMKELKKIKQQRPQLKVGISGCMVRTTSSRNDRKADKILSVLDQVDFVFRMEDLDQLEYMLREKGPNDVGRTFGDPSYLRTKPKHSSSFRGYLPIMSGCDNFCTFCIVPYSRGRERSRLMSEILFEANEMALSGITELLLIGQNVNSYGNKNEIYDDHIRDDGLQHPFTRLLREVSAIAGIRRIRFTSPHPKDITEELIKTMADLPNVCEHIHLPLQSGDDNILKRMNRHYTAEHFLRLVEMIRGFIPRIGLTTDIIVGFSGEEKQHFESTLRVARLACFDLSYTSMYSERKETYAGRFLRDDVPKEEKNRRYHELNDLIRETSRANNLLYLGEYWEILVEKIEDHVASGKTRTNRTVFFPSYEGLSVGDYVNVKVINALDWSLEGQLVMLPTINVRSMLSAHAL